jgi:hypothetical protein
MPAIVVTAVCFITFALLGCSPGRPADCPSPPALADRPGAVAAIGQLLDGWHEAAARADEEAYFSRLSEAAVFLGTDATERWDKAAFRDFAHPHFAKGKAWSFQAVRRDISLSDDGQIGWFDEDLDTPNLGPARGSGVVIKSDKRWLITHYNLTITVPNERFEAVKALLEQPPTPEPPAPKSPTPEPPTPKSPAPPDEGENGHD